MKFFRKWVDSLKWSRMDPLKRFATMVEDHLDGILSHCEKKVPLGYVESTSQKAKNVIHRAYGYRNETFIERLWKKLAAVKGGISTGMSLTLRAIMYKIYIQGESHEDSKRI